MADLPMLAGATFDDTDYDADLKLQKTGRLALITLAVLVFVFGLSAAVVPIGGAVIGSGQLGAESKVKRVAHPTGGVVAEIFVKDGDRVKAGQPLMRLDTTVSEASADLSGLSVDQLLAQRARLTAERDGIGQISFPTELTSAHTRSAEDAMNAERRQLSLHQRERADQRSQLVQRVSQYDEQINSYRAQIAALQKQKDLIQPEREGVRDLWQKDLVTINRLNQLERTAADLDGNIASLQANIAQTAARISETREQIISLDSTARADAGNQLAQINSTLNDTKVRNVNAADQYERSLIRAPADGVVDKLAITTIGGVITPGEALLEIVPVSDPLVVEASINPTDIDRVQVGQDARIRLSAFSQTTTPQIDAKVTFVSAERAVNPDTKASFYRVNLAIDAAQVKKEGLDLKVGMPAEVFIATGQRSMLSYVTKPLRDQVARAFKD